MGLGPIATATTQEGHGQDRLDVDDMDLIPRPTGFAAQSVAVGGLCTSATRAS